jgi:hypothetical protein
MPALLVYLHQAFTEILEGWRCTLLEFGGEADHVHLLVKIHPALNISTLINNLKTASARRARNQFAEHLKPFYWELYFPASCLLCGKRWRRYAGDRAALRGESEDQGKATQRQAARLTPSWPYGQGRGMRGLMFNHSSSANISTGNCISGKYEMVFDKKTNIPCWARVR